jgi:hypothetical protein
MVVLSQPGQAGDREAVVVLVNGENYGPLDQLLDLGRDGLLLGQSSGHMRTLAHSPDGPAPGLPTSRCRARRAGHAAAHTYASSLALANGEASSVMARAFDGGAASSEGDAVA